MGASGTGGKSKYRGEMSLVKGDVSNSMIKVVKGVSWDGMSRQFEHFKSS